MNPFHDKSKRYTVQDRGLGSAEVGQSGNGGHRRRPATRYGLVPLDSAEYAWNLPPLGKDNKSNVDGFIPFDFDKLMEGTLE